MALPALAPALFLPLALIAYIVGVFLASLGIAYRSAAARRAASWVFVVALLSHAAAVIHRGSVTGGVPLNGMGEYLLVLGCAVMALHLVIWFRFKVYVAGLVLAPLAAITAFAAWPLLSSTGHPPADAARGWFLFHITVSTLGMATLCVALAMSAIYLFQDHALKAHSALRLLERLPSLDRCDRIGLRALWIGFVMLTAGIVTGVVVNRVVHDTLWVGGPKQALPLMAWIVLAATLAARALVGFRGRKSAYLTIAGVVLGLATVLGMTL